MDESQDPREQLGLVHIYTGNGKGKTTAALGLSLRASGRGLKVLFLQFLKPEGGYGEQIACADIPGIDLIPMGLDHFVGMAKGEDVAAAHRCLSKAAELMGTGRYDVAVLDESINAVRLNLITSRELIDVLKGRPEHVEVILTGRGATEDLVDYADLVTDMRLVKHPFDKGIDARIGIEY